MDLNYFILLAILCAVGSIYFTFKSTRFENSRNRISLQAEIQKNRELTQQNADLSKRVSELGTMILEATDKMVSKGSMPLAQIWNYGEDSKSITFNIQLLGRHAIENVEVYTGTILDYKNSEYPLDTFALQLEAAQPPKGIISNLRNGNATHFIDFPIEHEDTCYVFFFKSNAGTWGQYVFRTHGENMSISIDGERKILEVKKSENFPIAEGGQVILNKNEKWIFGNMVGKKLDFHPNNEDKPTD